MSLPEAQKAVSEQPPSNSVVSPTSQVEQEQDVDRKLRLYGVVQAFRDGRMPDNAQIDETLLYVRDHSPIDTARLSPDGKKLIADVKDIIETVSKISFTSSTGISDGRTFFQARRFVAEKNADEVVQQFFYHTSSVDVDAKKPAVDSPVSEKEVRKDAREALGHLRTLFQLLVTNSEARKLLSDIQLVGRGMFADAASTVAERTRPPQEALEQVDDATPASKFVESPEQNSGPLTLVREVAVNATIPPPGPPVMDAARESAVEGNTNPAKKTLKSRFQGFTNRVPDKHKDRANAELENSKQYLKEQFPKERRDQFVYRLKKVGDSVALSLMQSTNSAF